MPAASADRPSVPIVTATIVIFAPNDRSSHMMRFDALPTKLRLCLMPLRMGIIAFFETVAFSALRFLSTTDKSDLLISSSSYAQLNNITCSSLVADSTKTFAHSISCFLLIRLPFGVSKIPICSAVVISTVSSRSVSTRLQRPGQGQPERFQGRHAGDAAGTGATAAGAMRNVEAHRVRPWPPHQGCHGSRRGVGFRRTGSTTAPGPMWKETATRRKTR